GHLAPTSRIPRTRTGPGQPPGPVRMLRRGPAPRRAKINAIVHKLRGVPLGYPTTYGQLSRSCGDQPVVPPTTVRPASNAPIVLSTETVRSREARHEAFTAAEAFGSASVAGTFNRRVGLLSSHMWIGMTSALV